MRQFISWQKIYVKPLGSWSQVVRCINIRNIPNESWNSDQLVCICCYKHACAQRLKATYWRKTLKSRSQNTGAVNSRNCCLMNWLVISNIWWIWAILWDLRRFVLTISCATSFIPIITSLWKHNYIITAYYSAYCRSHRISTLALVANFYPRTISYATGQ